MNKTILEQILEINAERSNYDFKAAFDWNEKSKAERCEIVKDILAFANTKDGGHIIIGIKEDNKTGKLIREGVSDSYLKSFNQANINNFIENYTDPKHSCEVDIIELNNKNFVVINIPEFKEEPILCKKCYDTIFSEGQIFTRIGDKSTPVSSSNEMREILGRALTKKGDKLLREIEIMIKGRPYEINSNDKEKFESDIKEAKNNLNEHLSYYKDNNGYIQLIVTPDKYNENFINEYSKIIDLISKSSVSMRGWSFPEIERSFNTNKGVIQIFDEKSFPRIKEGYYAFKSGAFIFERFFTEDLRENKPDNTLDFLSLMYTITEFLLFIKNYYSNFEELKNIDINVNLFKTKDRSLSNVYSPDYIWKNNKICKIENISISKETSVPNLKASWDNLALDIYVQICALFNFNMDINEKNAAKKVQNKFLNGNI